jgi:dihydrofolate reductase
VYGHAIRFKKKSKEPFCTHETVCGFILVNGDLEKEVIKIKKESGKDIAVFGGAELVSSLINLDLIDELVLAICPVVLGKGKPFFINIKERKRYRLKEVKSYISGLVSLTYER